MLNNLDLKKEKMACVTCELMQRLTSVSTCEVFLRKTQWCSCHSVANSYWRKWRFLLIYVECRIIYEICSVILIPDLLNGSDYIIIGVWPSYSKWLIMRNVIITLARTLCSYIFFIRKNLWKWFSLWECFLSTPKEQIGTSRLKIMM